MRNVVFFALAAALLTAECVAQFVLADQQMTALFAVLAIGLAVIRWVLAQRPAADGTDPEGEA